MLTLQEDLYNFAQETGQAITFLVSASYIILCWLEAQMPVEDSRSSALLLVGGSSASRRL